eukprot:Hpha_TRINITY_DN15596_c9_g1::TRINITY_DN15596_c9_g1_i1::g.105358::m.105358
MAARGKLAVGVIDAQKLIKGSITEACCELSGQLDGLAEGEQPDAGLLFRAAARAQRGLEWCAAPLLKLEEAVDGLAVEFSDLEHRAEAAESLVKQAQSRLKTLQQHARDSDNTAKLSQMLCRWQRVSTRALHQRWRSGLPTTHGLTMALCQVRMPHPSYDLWQNGSGIMKSGLSTTHSIMAEAAWDARGFICQSDGIGGFTAVFPSPTSAARWAHKVQLRLWNAEWPPQFVTNPNFSQYIDPQSGQVIFRGPRLSVALANIAESELLSGGCPRAAYTGAEVAYADWLLTQAEGGETVMCQTTFSALLMQQCVEGMWAVAGKGERIPPGAPPEARAPVFGVVPVALQGRLRWYATASAQFKLNKLDSERRGRQGISSGGGMVREGSQLRDPSPLPPSMPEIMELPVQTLTELTLVYEKLKERDEKIAQLQSENTTLQADLDSARKSAAAAAAATLQVSTPSPNPGRTKSVVFRKRQSIAAASPPSKTRGSTRFGFPQGGDVTPPIFSLGRESSAPPSPKGSPLIFGEGLIGDQEDSKKVDAEVQAVPIFAPMWVQTESTCIELLGYGDETEEERYFRQRQELRDELQGELRGELLDELRAEARGAGGVWALIPTTEAGMQTEPPTPTRELFRSNSFTTTSVLAPESPKASSRRPPARSKSTSAFSPRRRRGSRFTTAASVYSETQSRRNSGESGLAASIGPRRNSLQEMMLERKDSGASSRPGSRRKRRGREAGSAADGDNPPREFSDTIRVENTAEFGSPLCPFSPVALSSGPQPRLVGGSSGSPRGSSPRASPDQNDLGSPQRVGRAGFAARHDSANVSVASAQEHKSLGTRVDSVSRGESCTEYDLDTNDTAVTVVVTAAIFAGLAAVEEVGRIRRVAEVGRMLIDARQSVQGLFLATAFEMTRAATVLRSLLLRVPPPTGMGSGLDTSGVSHAASITSPPRSRSQSPASPAPSRGSTRGGTLSRKAAFSAIGYTNAVTGLQAPCPNWTPPQEEEAEEPASAATYPRRRGMGSKKIRAESPGLLRELFPASPAVRPRAHRGWATSTRGLASRHTKSTKHRSNPTGKDRLSVATPGAQIAAERREGFAEWVARHRGTAKELDMSAST